MAVLERHQDLVEELLAEVEAHAPGDTVKVTVLRDGKLMDLPVRLGES